MKFFFDIIPGYNLEVENQRTVNFLPGISKVNVLIGSNNSGKSRLLRHIFSTYQNKNTVLKALRTCNPTLNLHKFNNDLHTVKRNMNSPYKSININKYLMIEGENKENFAKMDSWLDEVVLPHLQATNINSDNTAKYLNIQYGISVYMDSVNQIIDSNSSLYFPVNRTVKNLLNYKDSIYFSRQSKYKQFHTDNLRKSFIEDISILEDLEYDDIIKHKFIDEYFSSDSKFSKFNFNQDPQRKTYQISGGSQSPTKDKSIFTGASIFQYVKETLLGTHNERMRFAEFERYLSIHFFKKQNISIISNDKKKEIQIKIGDDSPRFIYELGDGIQQLILLLLPIFMTKDKVKFVFIEEPELYMHPDLQRQFITRLISDFPYATFFLTTHSSNFLDILINDAECSIYILRKKDKQFYINTNNSDQMELLKCLNIKPSSIFLSNCTIWVEGITDLRYIRSLLDLYKKKNKDFAAFKEDIHYSIQYYGGSNYKNVYFDEFLSSLDRFNVSGVSNKVLIISDADDKDNKKSKEMSEKYGDKYFELSCRTIENTISLKIFKGMLKQTFNVEFNMDQSKYTSYKNKKYGLFLNQQVKSDLDRKFTDENDNLTNRYKMILSESFQKVSKDINYKDLTKYAKELTERIVSFIKDANNYSI